MGWLNSNNDKVFVKCTFESSLPLKIAQEAVDTCTSHANSKLASVKNNTVITDRQATNHAVNLKHKDRPAKALGSGKLVPELRFGF